MKRSAPQEDVADGAAALVAGVCDVGREVDQRVWPVADRVPGGDRADHRGRCVDGRAGEPIPAELRARL